MSYVFPGVIRRDRFHLRLRDLRLGPHIVDVSTLVETEPVIWLTLLPTPGGETQAEGSLTTPGVHLRWAFDPELGFPHQGFVVERRLYSVDEFLYATPQAWEVLPHGMLASPLGLNRNTLRSRMVGGAPAHVVRHVDAHLDSLMQLLEQAGDIPPVGSTPVHGGGVRTDVRPLDVLLLGALEPRFARGLGLYLVDGSLRAGVPADYRVTGRWGVNPWPQRSVYFDALLSQRQLAATGFFRLDWLTLFTSCACVADTNEASEAFLRVTGMSGANLRFLTEYAVGELELELAPGTTAGEWRVENAARQGADVSVNLQRQGSSLFIRPATTAQRFDELTLIPPAGGTLPSTLHLAGVHARRARGIVGNRMSLVARATPLENSPIDEENVSFPLAHAAQTPPLATVRPGTKPPSLRSDDGSVRVDVSRADIVCRPQPRQESGADNQRAVRLDVGVRPLDGSGPEVRLTGSSSSSHQAMTIVEWSLDKPPSSNGPALTTRGSLAFTKNRSAFIHELDVTRPALELYSRSGAQGELSKPGYLETPLSALSALQGKLDDIHVEIWAAPVEGPEKFPTLVGSSYKHSFWLGLSREPKGYRPRCWINGKGPYQASVLIPAKSWSCVRLSYDGAQVSFFVKGIPAGSTQAKHGPLQKNPRGTLCIGADPQRAGSADYAFSGFLADLRIWHHIPIPERFPVPAGDGSGPAAPVPLIDKTRSQRRFEAPSVEARGFADQPRYGGLRAAWPLDGQPLDVISQREDSERGTVRYAVGHPLDAQRRVLELDGNHVLEVLGRAPELYAFDEQLLVAARVFPSPIAPPSLDPRDPSHRVRPTMTILSADKETCFAFGLQAHGVGPTASYRPTLFLAGVEYASTFLIPPNSWSRVAALYDGSTVKFFVDARSEPDRPDGIEARRGPIGAAPGQIFRIGGEVDPDELTIKSAFVGRLADMEIWDRLPRRGESLPSAEGLEPAADFAAHDIEDGLYRFWVRGVDLFGRLGPKSYADTALDSFRKPPAPTTARAGFLPVRARVGSVVLPSDEDPRTRISLPRAALDTLPVARIVGYDLELIRPGLINAITGAASPHTESLEILAAETAGDALELSVRRSAFSLLEATADVDRPLEIPVDHEVRVEWTWTGAQRLFAPEVFAFRIAQRRRGTKTWSAPGGAHEFALVDDVIARDPVAAPLRTEPITHDEWQTLAGNEREQRGLRWLPEPAPGADGTAVYRLLLPELGALSASPHRLPPQDANPETFVPGALVALDETAQPPGWQVFQVHWHEWDASRGWTLLLTRKRSAEEARAPERTDATLLLRGARFYLGQRYRTLTAIDTGILSEPTVAYEICVRSVSRRDTRTLESDAGAGASLVAVDRRRPPHPPVPWVSIERANVHGRSRATVQWDVAPSGDRAAPAYLVYRAVDSAVHARDVELRRSRSGYYRGLTPEQIVADDRDFAGWIAESFPNFADSWQTRLFVPKPESFARPGQDAEWRRAWERYAEASVVWRAWSTRFHAGLTLEAASAGERSQLQEIAERPGMEAAFSLVAPSAVAAGPYVDDVNGNVRNAYIYRLRTQSPALVASAGWGGVSSAAFAPKTRPPPAPSFTKVEAADRQVTLHFALRDEFDLAEYRIYRSVDRASVEDVRWWTESPPERVSLRIPDPLLRVRDNALALPLELEAAEIVAVYRLADVAVEGSTSPPRPFNLFRTTRALGAPSRFDASTGRIEGLSPVRDGLPVAVVFRNGTGADREVRTLAPGVLVDTGLVGRADYYYVLTAVDGIGLASLPSKVLHARSTDSTPPTPPPWVSGQWVRVASDGSESPWVEDGGAGPDGVALVWEAVDPSGPSVAEIRVQRQSPAGAWVDVSGALPPSDTAWRDASAKAELTHHYRLLLRTAGGNVNRRFEIQRVERAQSGGAP